MRKAIKTQIDLNEVCFDEELYPRSQYSWEIAYNYAQSMRAGSVFPPIVLAIYKNKKILVDGKHRFEALKQLKVEKTDAIIYVGLTKEQIFKLAIKLNNTHGKGLTPYDKRKIALKLMEMKCSNSEISQLIFVPLDKLENFIGQRLVSVMADNPAMREKTILKSGVKHLAGRVMDAEDFEDIQVFQKDLGNDTQRELFKQVLNILTNKLLDKNDEKLMVLVREIKTLLNKTKLS